MNLSTRIIRPAIAAAAVLAVAAPAAQARPFDGSVGGATTVAVKPAAQHPAVVVRTITDTGFNWTDAGIGGASGLAVGMIALGGGMALRGRRRMALSS